MTDPTQPKKSFAWSTFLAGCIVGGFILPLVLASLALVALFSSNLPGPFMLLRNLSPFSSPSSLSSSSTAPTLPPTATNCGTDPTCLAAALKSCSPAESQLNSDQFNLTFKVLGASKKILGYCQVSLEIASINNDSLKSLGLDHQSMVCEVSPTVINRPSDILSAADSDLACDGPLWGLLKIVRAGQNK